MSMVQRAADPEDSRRVLVYATDAGLDLLAELQSAWTATMPNSARCSANATRANSSGC